ncbi:MAG: HAD family hydrolase [Spirochaetia bacterium]
MTVLVFDLGNVLITVEKERTRDNLNAVRPGAGDRFVRLLRDRPEWEEYLETGRWTPDEFLRKAVTGLGGIVTEEKIARAYADIFRINDAAVSLLPELKKRYPLYLLSNTNAIHAERGFLEYPFLSNFDELIMSHQVGAVKPDPDIYRYVENRTGQPPEAHLLIDDLPENIRGALDRGWDGVRFTGYADLIKAFHRRGIL